MGVVEGGRKPAALSLLVTKLHPPQLREQTVVRNRLVERLRASRGTKLTVVAAPAGSGKTTLLGAWREVEEPERSVAWLTLDEGDNDPVVLWSYVLAALQKALPGLQVSTSPERAGAGGVMDVVLPELINELASAGEVALVLDDFHRLMSGAARDSVAWFIDHAPATFRVVLATRSEPGIPLGALRAHGALLELRAHELAFTRDEADDLLNDRLSLGLLPASIDGLVERTEGWPAGLYLAALSLQAADDREEFVMRFGGGSRHVVDFLVDEVLDAHDPATQELMLRASILDRLSGPLCDAVLEQEGSDELLDGLARANLFLVPLDDRGSWYRFHHLFRQLLRVELEHREPGVTPVLHRRASAWHRDNGAYDAAIEHALAAGAFDEAEDLICVCWAEYTGASRYATILGWLKRMPDELLRRQANLLAIQAWVHAIRGDQGEAVRSAAEAERLASGGGAPLLDGFSSPEASLVTLRGLAPGGDTAAGLRNARRAAELEGPESPWRSLICFALGGGLYFSGEYEEALDWLTQAIDLGEHPLVAPTVGAYGSLVAGELGRMELQESLAHQALNRARELGTEHIEGEAFVAQGASLVARHSIEEALPWFERGAAVLRPRGHPRPLADALIRLAAALKDLGRGEAATAVIGEARVAIDSCPDPGVLPARLRTLGGSAPELRAVRDRALSDRELVILRMLGGRLSERDIGRELYLSHNTIHSHTKSIYRKLGVSSRSAALESARTLGII
jgi:LuxR family transcriptional regulator, maltose regulon positive regulatory protein